MSADGQKTVLQPLRYVPGWSPSRSGGRDGHDLAAAASRDLPDTARVRHRLAIDLTVRAVPVARAERHDGVEVAVETPAVLLARAHPQGLAPARQEHGPQQQRLHAARKGGVTGLDGEPTVPELVSEADLPKVGVPSMGRERHVGQHVRFRLVHEGGEFRQLRSDTNGRNCGRRCCPVVEPPPACKAGSG